MGAFYHYKSSSSSPKVLVIPRNRWLRLNMTEKLFTGTLNHNQKKKKKKKTSSVLTFQGFLFVGKLDGSVSVKLIKQRLDKPRGIALDLEKRYNSNYKINSGFVSSEDSDLIRVFTVHMKSAKVLCNSLSAQPKNQIKLDWLICVCLAQSLDCWICHIVTHIQLNGRN